MSEAPLATYHVWRSTVLELSKPQPRPGGIVELLHWFGSADVNPATGRRFSLRGTDLHTWHVQSWRRPRYVLTPRMTHLSIRAGREAGAFVRVRVLPFTAARPLGAGAQGAVADVLMYTGPAVSAAVTFTGGSIWFAGPDGADFRRLMSQDGPCQGHLQLPAGPGLLAIETSKRWSVLIQEARNDRA
jgi:hypothetical protein